MPRSLKGRIHCFEDGRDGFVFLQIDAANFSGAVVDVEVGGNFCLLGLHGDRSGFAAQQGRHAFHAGIVHGRTRAEMLFDITLRAEQAFFFAAPQADADGAAGLDVERFQNAHGFHHDDGACAVVGRARAGVPGIEVRAEHDDFIFLVGAGNFGDGVVLHGVVVVESVGDVQFEGDVFFLLQQAGDAAPVLGGHGELRDGGGFAGLVGSAGLDENGAAAGGAAAVVDDGQNFFVGEELVQIFDELAAA